MSPLINTQFYEGMSGKRIQPKHSHSYKIRPVYMDWFSKNILVIFTQNNSSITGVKRDLETLNTNGRSRPLHHRSLKDAVINNEGMEELTFRF